jgi:PAS domain S-box-containing protein
MDQTIFTLDAYVALLVVLINFVFAILILVRTPRTLFYGIFLFICIANVFWNFGDFMAYFTQNRFWFYFSLIGSGMLPALMFHWVNTIVKPEKKSTLWIVPPYFFSGFLAFSSPLTILHPKVQWFVDSDVWNILFLVLLAPFLLAGMIMLFYATRRAKSEDEKSRLRYFLIAALIGVPTGLTDLIQIFKIPVPPLGHIGCLTYSSILAIGVLKHRRAYDILVQMKEEALRKSEEKHRTILHSLEEGYFEVDLAGNLTFFNDAFVKWSGYSKKELMGMNNRQFMDEETAKKVYQVFNEVYRAGEPANPFDWEIILKDGTRRWIETSVSLIRDSRGQPIGFQGIARDVTQRKQVEVALRESGEKYRTILNNIEEGYYEVDLAGNVIFFNDSLCKVIGYAKEELMGMNNRQLMTDEMARRVYQTFNEVYRTGIPAKEFDWELVRKDGTKRFIEASISLLRDSKGQPIGFYGIARDITVRKQAEEQAKIHQQQLMQAGKMVALGTLVSSVAHEINNPNNFIMLNAPLLKEVWENVLPILDEYCEKNRDFTIGSVRYAEMRDRIPRLLSGIKDGSNRIKQIVEDLRDFVRRDASDMNQSADVNAVLRSAISLLSNMITKSTSHFYVKYGEKMPVLKGNFHRLEQVMINLIQNACQALPDVRRSISLSTVYDEKTSCIVVKVQDEGVGIPPEALPHITAPFFTTKSDSGGIGLGLSISSRIIKEHGGTLTFNSEPGRGTTAEIILPVLGAYHDSKGAVE